MSSSHDFRFLDGDEATAVSVDVTDGERPFTLAWTSMSSTSVFTEDCDVDRKCTCDDNSSGDVGEDTGETGSERRRGSGESTNGGRLSSMGVEITRGAFSCSGETFLRMRVLERTDESCTIGTEGIPNNEVVSYSGVVGMGCSTERVFLGRPGEAVVPDVFFVFKAFLLLKTLDEPTSTKLKYSLTVLGVSAWFSAEVLLRRVRLFSTG